MAGLTEFIYEGDALSSSFSVTTVLFFYVKSISIPDKRKSPVSLTAVVDYL